MIELEGFDIDNILIDEKSHFDENILIYDISYKILIDSKLLRIKVDKIDGFIGIYHGPRYVTLFGSESYDVIHNIIRYLISIKSSITYTFSLYYTKIKIDFYGSLPVEKNINFTFYNTH